jgi:hypothetical protein
MTPQQLVQMVRVTKGATVLRGLAMRRKALFDEAGKHSVFRAFAATPDGQAWLTGLDTQLASVAASPSDEKT